MSIPIYDGGRLVGGNVEDAYAGEAGQVKLGLTIVTERVRGRHVRRIADVQVVTPAATHCTWVRERRPQRTARARRPRVMGRRAAARAPGGDDPDPEPPGGIWSLLSLLGPRDLYAVSALAERYADDLIGGER